MNVTSTAYEHYVSSLRTARFAAPEGGRGEISSAAGKDQAIISREGRAYLEAFADITEKQISAMTREDFMGMLETWQRENQAELEISPYRAVDPDGSIARKTYFESYLGQLEEKEEHIRRYYAGAYGEAVSAPVNSLAYIAGKYLSPWSDYYDPDIPAEQRQWTHHQLWAMLTGSGVALNDPYALADYGGARTAEEMDRAAREAVREKLEGLCETASEKTAGAREVSKEEEMEAFKREFYAELDKIPKDRTIANVAINISEEAFRNMKADPEYREQMLSVIRRDMTGSVAPAPDCSMVITVGATAGDYRADSWSVNNDAEFYTRSRSSFYKRMDDKKADRKERMEAYLEKRAQMKRQRRERMREKTAEIADFNGYEQNQRMYGGTAGRKMIGEAVGSLKKEEGSRQHV